MKLSVGSCPSGGHQAAAPDELRKENAMLLMVSAALSTVQSDTLSCAATYKVFVKSLGFETADGIVEIPVGVELDPKGTANGLENGWKGAEIGSLIYGTEDCGIFAAETTIDWIGYRLALMVNGEEVSFTSVTYNVTINGLTFE